MQVSAFGAGLGEAHVPRVGLGTVLDAAAAWGNQRALPGVLTVFSLHATKGVVAGEGGASAVHDPRMAERLRDMTNFGMATGVVGTNAKMSEYHAAVALASLETWPERSERRRAAAAFYRDALSVEIPTLGWQSWDDAWTRTIFPVLLPKGSSIAKVMRLLERDGVESRRWYHPLVCDSYRFSESHRWALSNARAISDRLIGLPFFTGITEEQMQRVAKLLKGALAEAA
jgi:dTDP-4-amino-4,6-dideoxygalactose transaminase